MEEALVAVEVVGAIAEELQLQTTLMVHLLIISNKQLINNSHGRAVRLLRRAVAQQIHQKVPILTPNRSHLSHGFHLIAGQHLRLRLQPKTRNGYESYK
jgi:hypothetical protein